MFQQPFNIAFLKLLAELHPVSGGKPDPILPASKGVNSDQDTSKDDDWSNGDRFSALLQHRGVQLLDPSALLR
jgi:hypothetical protein